MKNALFTFIIVFLLSFSISIHAATNGVVDGVLNTAANAVKYVTGSAILDSLIPDKKNCNYVREGKYQPFSDIDSSFPGASTLGGTTGKNGTFCINVRTEGTENLLKLLFTTAISIIIVLTVINIAISGIQYMTQEANIGKKGEAKKRLQNSIIALMLGLLSYTILYTVNKQLVEFTFNPAGIDADGSINQGIAAAVAAQQQSAALSSTFSGIEAIMAPIYRVGQPGYVGSPTGWVNPYTKVPCTPANNTPTAPIPRAIPVTEPLTRILKRGAQLATVSAVAYDYGVNPFQLYNGGLANPTIPNTVAPPAVTPSTGAEPCVPETGAPGNTLLDEYNNNAAKGAGVADTVQAYALNTAALAMLNQTTCKVSNTDGGKRACAYVVNSIINNALGKPITGETGNTDTFGRSTSEMKDALDKSTRFYFVGTSIGSIAMGDIIISPTIGNNTGHVGIYTSTGKIVSNSTSQLMVDDQFTPLTWINYFNNQKNLVTYIYRARAQ